MYIYIYIYKLYICIYKLYMYACMYVCMYVYFVKLSNKVTRQEVT